MTIDSAALPQPQSLPQTLPHSLPHSLPFSGLKVIDCASYIAAPAAAAMLGDFGADVLKVEPPEGDPLRDLWRLPGTPAAEHNYPWDLDSRNKRSLVLDLKQPAAQAALHRLVAQADVFITNLPLPVRQRLGIGQATLCGINPRLVYGSMTAYGETGPEAEKTGFDATAYWARSGLMDMIRPDHSAAPARAVAGMGDHPSAVALFGAIVMGLYRRQATGLGGMVSTSLLANGLWANGVQVQAHLSGVVYPSRRPRSHSPNAFGNVYQCRDGRWLNLVLLNEARQAPALFQTLGCPQALDDPRFATKPAREVHHAELIAVFDACFAQRDLADWRTRLDAAGITFGVVGTLADIDGDVQMHASGALVAQDGAAGMTVASPIQIDGLAQRRAGPAPTLGQHSAQVLREAGFSAAEIAGLRATGAVLGAAPIDQA